MEFTNFGALIPLYAAHNTWTISAQVYLQRASVVTAGVTVVVKLDAGAAFVLEI